MYFDCPKMIVDSPKTLLSSHFTPFFEIKIEFPISEVEMNRREKMKKF